MRRVTLIMLLVSAMLVAMSRTKEEHKAKPEAPSVSPIRVVWTDDEDFEAKKSKAEVIIERQEPLVTCDDPLRVEDTGRAVAFHLQFTLSNGTEMSDT